jgi:hypothetical protein
MELVIGEVFKHLVSFGPWAVLGGLALYLLRGELGKLFVAPKEDRALEALLKDMNGLFEKNLVYFEKTANSVEIMVTLLRELNQTQHQVVNELIRRKD